MMRLTGIFLLIATSPLLSQDTPCYTLKCLSRLSFDELEQIYLQAEPGNPPQGSFRGTTKFRECEFLSGPRQVMTNIAWCGKHFCGDGLINQFRGLRIIEAKVYPGESWIDGKPAHILDYRGTSKIWHDVRDETREVSTGVYVGAMFLDRCKGAKYKLLFILEAECK